jgi:hypothetical protein
MSVWRPGDLLRLSTLRGPRYVQITHTPRPYPPVLRALIGETADTGTAFIAMAELPGDDPRIAHVATAPIPQADSVFPTFGLAVKDRAGEPVYWWHWDGDGLRLAPDGANCALPLREITPVKTLIAALAAL